MHETIPADILCAADYVRHSRARMDAGLLAHVDGGSGEEWSLRANRQAFARYAIYNRVLNDCSGGHISLKLLGRSLAHPLLLAPVAAQRLLHPLGELATAEAAEATDSGLVVSARSSCTLAEIAACGPATRWYQLYWQADDSANRRLLEQAELLGYQAAVLTLDAPAQSPNRAAQRLGFRLPAELETPSAQLAGQDSPVFQGLMSQAPRWADLRRLLASTSLPIVVKGVSHPDDAERLIEAGVSGLIVSNHGGRALDGAPASLLSLPPIRARVGASLPILLDGGIRSGSDVFKAIALGADAVLIGRLQAHALALAGALGVAHMLKLLRQELELTMALAGCAALEQIGPHCLWRQEIQEC